MTTEQHCPNLRNLNKVDAIRAIHLALLQLNAVDSGIDCTDDREAKQRLSDCMKQAGHPGFN